MDKDGAKQKAKKFNKKHRHSETSKTLHTSRLTHILCSFVTFSPKMGYMQVFSVCIVVVGNFTECEHPPKTAVMTTFIRTESGRT